MRDGDDGMDIDDEGPVAPPAPAVAQPPVPATENVAVVRAHAKFFTLQY